MIKQFHQHVNEVVSGVYRLKELQRSYNYNDPMFTVATLEDDSGQTYCGGWAYNLCSRSLIGRLFQCELYVHQRPGGLLLTRFSQASLVEQTPISYSQKLKGAQLPQTDSLHQVRSLIEKCPLAPIQDFLLEVFKDRALSTSFFTIPASLNYHHAFPGGLAVHSIETAQSAVSSLLYPTDEERALTLAAALLHDIGKIRTHHSDGYKTTEGRLIQHEQLTLELLAKPLQSLDKTWPDGAIALRYLLTCRSEKIKRPYLPCAIAINAADRLSSAQSAREMAFEDGQPFQRFATTSSKGPKSTFWKPRPPKRSIR